MKRLKSAQKSCLSYQNTLFFFKLNILVGELKERLILVILELEAWIVTTRNISNHNLKYKKIVN